MCTATWIRTQDGYELFCNRDESLTRKSALPPQVLNLGDTQAIAPRDGDFGGSWISVNEFGLSLCLLNLYSVPRLSGEFTSRGLLLMELAGSHSPEQVIARMAEKRLQQFQPFTLLALAVGQLAVPAVIFQWNGSERLIDRDGDRQMPLTSSSFDSANVIESRKRCFDNRAAAAGGIDADLLFDFHRSHDPLPSAYSTCMHRADAQTVSFSQIKVGSNSIEFRYHPHSPCRTGEAEIKTLQRTKQ
jgi:hypothetical protein